CTVYKSSSPRLQHLCFRRAVIEKLSALPYRVRRCNTLLPLSPRPLIELGSDLDRITEHATHYDARPPRERQRPDLRPWIPSGTRNLLNDILLVPLYLNYESTINEFSKCH